MATLSIAVTGAVGYANVVDEAPEAKSGYCAEMPDAIGLYEGNPVTQMGFQVGKVDHIEPKGDHVRVTFALDGGRRYPADVQAVTRSKSLLADRSLELVGNYESGPQLTDGQCISLDRSYTPKSISEITGSTADFIDKMAPRTGENTVETAVAGLAEALRGNGTGAQSMMLHASGAMSSPDQLVADIGSSIMNMAPLTDETLQRWATLRSILDQLPEVVAAGSDLWQGPIDVIKGVAYLTPVLLDIHQNDGDVLWPLLHGGVADLIHLAATRSKDIQSLMSTVPSIAAAMRQQSAASGGFTMAYQPPTVEISRPDAPQLCAALNQALAGSCAPDGAQVRVPAARMLDLVLAKGK
ncbi:virulence factor Mce family protein [Rhodococcus aetherivorans]|nr:virulence factor Mce family protein [Rhodococcus aetherivorans]